jgi:hypothetical protein
VPRQAQFLFPDGRVDHVVLTGFDDVDAAVPADVSSDFAAGHFAHCGFRFSIFNTSRAISSALLAVTVPTSTAAISFALSVGLKRSPPSLSCS